MALRKRESIVTWNRKHQILPYRELDFEEATDLSQGQLRNEYKQFFELLTHTVSLLILSFFFLFCYLWRERDLYSQIKL